jgi:hypothetical protein
MSTKHTPGTDPRELAELYKQAHDALCALPDPGALRDVRRTWGNTLGLLRRVQGQPYFRAGPNGRLDEPTDAEKAALADYFRITIQRARAAIAKATGQGEG